MTDVTSDPPSRTIQLEPQPAPDHEIKSVKVIDFEPLLSIETPITLRLITPSIKASSRRRPDDFEQFEASSIATFQIGLTAAWSALKKRYPHRRAFRLQVHAPLLGIVEWHDVTTRNRLSREPVVLRSPEFEPREIWPVCMTCFGHYNSFSAWLSI